MFSSDTLKNGVKKILYGSNAFKDEQSRTDNLGYGKYVPPVDKTGLKYGKGRNEGAESYSKLRSDSGMGKDTSSRPSKDSNYSAN